MNIPSVWKGQSARVFVGFVLLASVSLFFFAEKLGSEEHPTIYGVLSHLAAMLLAAFVAAVFFSFREIRELLAASLSTLLLDGEISKQFSPGHRADLRRKLLFENLSDRVGFLEPQVLDRLEAVEEQSLVLPHHHGFASTVTLTDIPDYPDLLYHHVLTSYRVSCRHLKNSKGLYRLLVGAEISNPTAALDTDVLRKFHIRAGSESFAASDATVTKTRSAGLDIIHVSFDREIEVEKELDVLIEVESVSSRSDPAEIRFIRYPTYGFRYTLVYRDDLSYDVAWFRARVPAHLSAQVAAREEVELTPKGITAYTHQWLFPGDGAVLFWFPQPRPTSPKRRPGRRQGRKAASESPRPESG